MNKLLGIFLLFLAAVSVHGQTTNGTLTGTVRDSSTALVSGASVTVVNTATGVKYTGATNGEGFYRVANLPYGTYNVTIKSPSFAPTNVNGVTVAGSQVMNEDAVLALSATASVEVTSIAPVAIDTTTPQIQQTFSMQEVQDLPSATSGNGVLNLSLLSAGVASTGGLGAGTGPSVGGQRPRNNNFMIDGVDNNNKSVTGPLLFVPNDAIGEFTLLQNVYSAEYGHSTGGQFNSLIQTGTNSVHGRLYEYFNNRKLNAVDAKQAKSNVGAGNAPGFRPRYDYNRYGGQLGGPVLKDKLFLFSNFERQELGQAGSASVFCSPTASGFATLNGLTFGAPGSPASTANYGVFKQFSPAAPKQASSTDANCPSSIAVQNQAGATSNVPVGDVSVNLASFSNSTYSTSSGDYTIGSHDSLRVRYVYNRADNLDTSATFSQFYISNPHRYHLASIDEIHTFTPALSNEFRVGFTRYYNVTAVPAVNFPGLNAFPNVILDELGGVNIGPDPNAPQETIINTYQAVEGLSYIKGKHTVKVGADVRKLIAPSVFIQRLRGDYEYGTTSTYFNDFSPDVLGQRNATPPGVPPVFYGDQIVASVYANDDWKATPRLTINLGLRYEHTTIPYSERLQTLNAAASVPGLIAFTKPNSQSKNFAPRIGLNYSPDGSTSIRAGFGIGYDVLYDNIGTTSAPPQFQTTQNVNLAANSPNFLGGGGLPANAAISSVASQRALTSGYVPDQKLPYSEQWVLSVEHVFAKNYTLEARYVGTRGVHLDLQDRLNIIARVTPQNSLSTSFNGAPAAANGTNTLASLIASNGGSSVAPAFQAAGFTSNIVGDFPFGGSNYNGLALQLTRRMTNGLSVNASYTYSKTMDDSTADFNTTSLTPRRVQDFQNIRNDYARSALDRTHRLTIETVYDLPFFKKSNWFAKNLIGNWEAVPVYTLQSPEYATVQSGIDSNLNGDSASDRVLVNPNGVRGTGTGVVAYVNPAIVCSGAAKYNAANGNGGTLYTACAANTIGYSAGSLVKGSTAAQNSFAASNAYYVQAGAGVNPTSSRNTLPTGRENNFDLSLYKRLSFMDRYKLEFGAQAFNVLNHSQYLPGSLNDVASIGSADAFTRTFAQVNQPAFNNPKAVFSNQSRAMQLSGKIIF